MSEACGLKSIGTCSEMPYVVNAICGLTEDVAQVSITSFSGSNSAEPQSHFFFGLSFKGSTGKSFTSARIMLLHCLQYHKGKGTPKNLCLLMHQSHCRFSTQCSYLFFMNPGYHAIRFPASIHSSFLSSMRVNHCLVFKNSIGVSQRSCTFATCLIFFWLLSSPAAFKSSRIALRACLIVSVAYFPAISLSAPSLFSTDLNGNLYWCHHSTSDLSPKVQTISNPVPFAGS